MIHLDEKSVSQNVAMFVWKKSGLKPSLKLFFTCWGLLILSTNERWTLVLVKSPVTRMLLMFNCGNQLQYFKMSLSSHCAPTPPECCQIISNWIRELMLTGKTITKERNIIISFLLANCFSAINDFLSVPRWGWHLDGGHQYSGVAHSMGNRQILEKCPGEKNNDYKGSPPWHTFRKFPLIFRHKTDLVSQSRKWEKISRIAQLA